MNKKRLLKQFSMFKFWKVNFFDLCWFVFVLRCDEFSHKLDLNNYIHRKNGINKLCYDRERAHKIEQILSN